MPSFFLFNDVRCINKLSLILILLSARCEHIEPMNGVGSTLYVGEGANKNALGGWGDFVLMRDADAGDPYDDAVGLLEYI